MRLQARLPNFQRLLADGASTRDAAADVAGRFGLPKKRVYNLALELGR